MTEIYIYIYIENITANSSMWVSLRLAPIMDNKYLAIPIAYNFVQISTFQLHINLQFIVTCVSNQSKCHSYPPEHTHSHSHTPCDTTKAKWLHFCGAECCTNCSREDGCPWGKGGPPCDEGSGGWNWNLGGRSRGCVKINSYCTFNILIVNSF